MNRLSTWALFFSAAFLVFFVAPPFLSQPFAGYPLMMTGDLVDIFTPLVLIPLYWLLFRAGGEASPREMVAFLVLAAFWVEGQGMHLASNSIGHLFKGMPDSDIHRLTHFYDEVLSHYIWHFGVMGLSALLLFHGWRSKHTEESATWLLGLSGVIYGFTFFLIVVEGGTVLMGVPFAVLVTLWGLFWGRARLKQQPLLVFFLASYLVASLLFAGWGLYWGGFPEFSEVGIIS